MSLRPEHALTEIGCVYRSPPVRQVLTTRREQSRFDLYFRGTPTRSFRRFIRAQSSVFSSGVRARPFATRSPSAAQADPLCFSRARGVAILRFTRRGVAAIRVSIARKPRAALSLPRQRISASELSNNVQGRSVEANAPSVSASVYWEPSFRKQWVIP
jgi:hypothetical protein